MLLTATCTRPEVDEIRKNLTIEENNFVLFRDSASHRQEINSNNIRAVIHIGAPMSISMYGNYLLVIINIFSLYLFCAIIANLIQEAGRAGRDGNTATHFIFFSKKDIRTNYSIVAEHRET